MSKYEDQRKAQSKWKNVEPPHDERVYVGTRKMCVQFDFDRPSPSDEIAVLIRRGDRAITMSTAEAMDLARVLIEWCSEPLADKKVEAPNE